MKAAQFQRFLVLHAKKYGLLTKGKVFKQTERGVSRFFIRSDKLTLFELVTMYQDHQVYATNRSLESSWVELMKSLRKVTVPGMAITTGTSHRDHEQEFLLWIDKLASFVIPVNTSTPLEQTNFSSLDEIRRRIIGLSIKTYNKLAREDNANVESILPRALAAVLLYKISHVLHANFLKLVDSSDLSSPVSLDYLSGEVMLSMPTLQKAKQKLEGI